MPNIWQRLWEKQRETVPFGVPYVQTMFLWFPSIAILSLEQEFALEPLDFIHAYALGLTRNEGSTDHLCSLDGMLSILFFFQLWSIFANNSLPVLLATPPSTICFWPHISAS